MDKNFFVGKRDSSITIILTQYQVIESSGRYPLRDRSLCPDPLLRYNGEGSDQ